MSEDRLYLHRFEVRKILIQHQLAAALREVDALPIFTAEDIEKDASPGRQETSQTKE